MRVMPSAVVTTAAAAAQDAHASSSYMLLPYEERWSQAQIEECVDLWDLTEDETAKLLECQDRIADVQHWKNCPFEVIRFLREFKFNLHTTEQKFRASIQWRLEHKADTILEDYTPPALYNYFPLGVLRGSDKDGDPIYIERSGAADTLGLLHRFGKDEMIQQAIWGKELMTRGPWQKGRSKRVKYFVTILDLKGLNRHHLNPSLVPVGQQVTRLVQDNYPGIGKKILVVRAPSFFRFVWNIFKHFIDPHVKDLIEIATEKETEEVLAKYMDLSVLPKEIVPGKGHGQAERGYEPIWEGGTLPPPGKDDWKRGTPVFGGTDEEDAIDNFETVLLQNPFSKQNSYTTPVKVAVDETAIQPSTSNSTSMSSVSSSSEWESLPKRTSRRNIQQAWTVTPEPIFDLEEVWSKENFNDMARLWKLTNVEQLHMEDLKERLADIHHCKNDPFEVIRWYKEFKGDLDKVEHKFRKMIAWRVENDMDNYMERYGQPDPLFHHVPLLALRGTDRDGDPIHIERMGSCDYYGLLKHFGADPIVDFYMFISELNSCRRFWQPYEEEAGHRIKHYTIIIDLDGLGPRHLRPGLLPLLNRISRINQDNYAGWAKRILLIRAPAIFRFAWSLVKGFFDPQIREMVQVASHSNYLQLLDLYMDREVLPPCICPEEGVGDVMPGFYENVMMEGGLIPKEAFRQGKEKSPGYGSQSVPVFKPMPTTPHSTSSRSQSAPMPPSTSFDDLPHLPSSPVSTTHLMAGFWDENDNDDEKSIRTVPTTEKEKQFTSPMFKYNW